MLTILHLNDWRGVTQAIAMSLVVFALTALVACSGDKSEETTQEPQSTATPALAATQATAAPTPAAPTPAPTARQTPAPTPTATPADPGPALQVVATTNFVGDWVRNVGGDRVEVFSLLPPGGDPHTFLPGVRDVAKVADADLIFTVGLGLEVDWLEDLLHNASADESKMIALGELVDPIEFMGPDPHGHGDDERVGEHGDEEGREEDEHEGDDHEEDEHGDDHGPTDPHFWFDPIRVKVAVDEIAEHLAEANPQSADFFHANAENYKAQIDELHAWTLEQVEQVAPERRLLLTSHDTFGYFALLYGFEVVGMVIPSLATHVEPSPEHIAELVGVVREHNVPAIFAENTVDDRLVKAIALETGAKMFHLYTGSLGPEGSDGETYLGMVRSNVEHIVEALK